MESIVQFINRYDYKDRENKVLEAIGKFLANNHESMLDGITKHIVKFGPLNESRIANLYNIPDQGWNKFRKSNKLLQRDMQVSGNLMRLCLVTSYFKTKNKTFLDFLAITMYGARFSRYFSKGVKEHIMKHVIENVITGKSLFKQHGSSYLVMQETVETMINAKDTSEIGKAFIRQDDQAIVDIINSMYTRINLMLNNIADHYYTTNKAEKTGYIISVSDEADDGKLSLSNNSLRISNLKNVINNLSTNNLDELILKTLRLESSLKRACVTSILCNSNKRYFNKYADIYIDYYIKNRGTDWNKMKRDFISFSNKARTNSKEMKDIDTDVTKDIRVFVKNYLKMSKVDPEDLKNSNGILKLVRVIKDYVIIKIRHLMNEV